MGDHPSVVIISRSQKSQKDEHNGDKKKDGDANVNDDEPNSLAALTAEFCNNVLGKEAWKRAERFRLGNKLLTMKNALAIILREHYFTASWMFASLFRTRTLRFLECFKTLLMAMFIDTLIYGIFFPSDGKCESYQTKRACLVPQSKLGGNQCVWSHDAAIRCTTTPAPNDLISNLILALVITVLIRPALLLLDMLTKICERRPRFELWWKRWNANSWFGSLHHASYLDYSPLALAFVYHDETKQMQDPDASSFSLYRTPHFAKSNATKDDADNKDEHDVELGRFWCHDPTTSSFDI